MDHNEGTNLTESLNQTLALYYGNDNLYNLLRRDPSFGEVKDSMTRVLFESGFIFGERWMIEAALDLDQTIAPEPETTLTTIHTHLRHGELVPCYNEVRLLKTQDQVAWQTWRLEGVRERVYQPGQFPTYEGLSIYPLDPRRAVIHSNVEELGAKVVTYTEKQLDTGREVTVEYPFTFDRSILCSVDSPYRFVHRAVFSRPLPDALIDILQKREKANH
ncbi:hypothetical protein HYT55_00260 [Candidatus Woesearchaeota archaeon]|nr:hypothetical protein [Candidatus Woesearchaeota archaeon]